MILGVEVDHARRGGAAVDVDHRPGHGLDIEGVSRAAAIEIDGGGRKSTAQGIERDGVRGRPGDVDGQRPGRIGEGGGLEGVVLAGDFRLAGGGCRLDDGLVVLVIRGQVENDIGRGAGIDQDRAEVAEGKASRGGAVNEGDGAVGMSCGIVWGHGEGLRGGGAAQYLQSIGAAAPAKGDAVRRGEQAAGGIVDGEGVVAGRAVKSQRSDGADGDRGPPFKL